VSEAHIRYLKKFITAFFLASLSVGVANAQKFNSSSEYHPFLSDKFNIGVGVFRPTQDREIGIDTNMPGLSDTLNVSNSSSVGILNFRWRFTENWSFQTTYWNTESENGETLDEDFEFHDKVFLAGSFVNSGFDTEVARLFWGRSFFRKPNIDWGVGAGLHWLTVDIFVEGQVLATPGPGREFRHTSASAAVPLPNLGIWYMYSWSPKWVVLTRFDWLEVSFEEFSGSMYDASVGVNYQISDHFGVGLAVNAFKLDVQVDQGNWDGGIETNQYGPRLNLTWNL